MAGPPTPTCADPRLTYRVDRPDVELPPATIPTLYFITLDGGFEEYLHVPGFAVHRGNVFGIPDGVGYAEAALVESFSCRFRIEEFNEAMAYAASGAGLKTVIEFDGQDA